MALDIFLEVVCGRTKKAEAEARQLELMRRLPQPLLQKIASGNIALDASGSSKEGGSWLDQFKGSPLLQDAIALEKEELQVQMDENERRQAENEVRSQYPGWEETSAVRDEIALKRKLLELELAGVSVDGLGGGGEDVGGEELPVETEEAPVDVAPAPEEAAAAGGPPAPPGPPVAVEEEGPPAPPAQAEGGPPPAEEEGGEEEGPPAEAKEEGPPAEKKEEGPPKSEKKTEVSVKDKRPEPKAEEKKEEKPEESLPKAAAAMRRAYQEERAKLAFLGALGQAAKGVGNFAKATGSRIGTAYTHGGIPAAATAMRRAGTQGLQQAGQFAAQNPGTAAGLVAAPALGAGYALGRGTGGTGQQ